MTGPSGDLPFLDTHTVAVAVGPDDLWPALRRYVGALGLGAHHPLARLLGTDPPGGFEIAEEAPGERVVLTGRHRFARYRLVFAIEPRPEGRTTLLHAHSYAVFPGPAGRVYRTLVVGTRLHVVATRRMLRHVTHGIAEQRRT